MDSETQFMLFVGLVAFLFAFAATGDIRIACGWAGTGLVCGAMLVVHSFAKRRGDRRRRR